MLVKVFENYHDLPENRIIRFWLNNASIRRYALSLQHRNVYQGFRQITN